MTAHVIGRSRRRPCTPTLLDQCEPPPKMAGDWQLAIAFELGRPYGLLERFRHWRTEIRPERFYLVALYGTTFQAEIFSCNDPAGAVRRLQPLSAAHTRLLNLADVHDAELPGPPPPLRAWAVWIIPREVTKECPTCEGKGRVPA